MVSLMAKTPAAEVPRLTSHDTLFPNTGLQSNDSVGGEVMNHPKEVSNPVVDGR